MPVDVHQQAHTPDASLSKAQHGAGFVISGGMAFLSDAAVLSALVHLAGADPFTARIFAIGVAMVVGWLCHRRLTFAVQSRPSVREFMKYAAVAWSAAALNYAIYAGILLAVPTAPPLVALFVASIAAMAASYAGMRFGVFRGQSQLR